MLKSGILTNIRENLSGFSDLEAWDIEYKIEDILNVKYGSAKDTMLKFETYVMYNTSDKAVFLPTVRDRKLRVISGYINLNNVAEPNSEF